MYDPTCLISSSPDPVSDHHQEVAAWAFRSMLVRRMPTASPEGVCIPSVNIDHIYEDVRMVSEVHLQIDDTWTEVSDSNKSRTIRLRTLQRDLPGSWWWQARTVVFNVDGSKALITTIECIRKHRVLATETVGGYVFEIRYVPVGEFKEFNGDLRLYDWDVA